jgi:hypothetical protein
MRILVTESQLRSIIKEQNLLDKIKTGAQNLYKNIETSVNSNPMLNNSKMLGSGPAGSAIGSIQMDPHTRNAILQTMLAFVPVAGPLLSTIVGEDDAYQYYKEGDKKKAAVVGLLSTLPVLGQIANKIPILKKLGQQGMEKLAEKIFSGSGTLTADEATVMNVVNQNSGFISGQLKTIANSPTTQAIAKQGLKYAHGKAVQTATQKAAEAAYDLANKAATDIALKKGAPLTTDFARR